MVVKAKTMGTAAGEHCGGSLPAELLRIVFSHCKKDECKYSGSAEYRRSSLFAFRLKFMPKLPPPADEALLACWGGLQDSVGSMRR